MLNGQNDGFLYFCDFQNAFGRGICVRDAFLSILCEKVKIYVNLDPNFLGRAVHFLFSVNLEGFFTMVGEIPVFCARKKRKEKTRLRNAKFSSFLHFSRRININHAFKTKKVTFRERILRNAKLKHFCIPQPRKSLRDFSDF